MSSPQQPGCRGGDFHHIRAGAVELADLHAHLYQVSITVAQPQARAVQDFQPDLVALSTMIALHLRSTATVIAAIRALPKHGKVRVLVGGGPFLQVPDLWKKVGADGTASDAASAVIRADELVSA